EKLEAGLLGSLRYFRRAGGNSTRFLAALSRDVVGQPLSGSARQRYRALLAAGTSREKVAALGPASRPAPENLARGDFLRYLHRAATAEEVSSAVGALQHGRERLVVSLLSSTEYFARLEALLTPRRLPAAFRSIPPRRRSSTSSPLSTAPRLATGIPPSR